MRGFKSCLIRTRVVSFFARLIFIVLPSGRRSRFFLYLIRKNKHGLIKNSQKLNLFKKHPISPVGPRKKIIGYLPRKSSGWILQYLFDDIAFASDSSAFLKVDSLENAYVAASKAPDSIFLAMHYYLVDELIGIGIPPSKILAFYTHSRINSGIPEVLHRIKGILPMNSCEASLLLLANINPKALRVFPAGYDPNKFFFRSNVDKDCRDIDLVVSCRFSDSVEPAYGPRKGYDLILTLANSLAADLKQIALVGPGWKKATMLVDSRVHLMELSYDEYPSLYRRSKIFASLSLQEGGPVSWLEAMASGCITVSSATGFPLEIESGKLGSYLMPIKALPSEWVAKIKQILKHYKPLPATIIDSRRDFLRPSSFDSLSEFLLQVLYADSFNECHSWPTRVSHGDVPALATSRQDLYPN